MEEVPEAAGEVAFEGADAGDGDAVDGGVDLAVASAVEAVALGVAGADRDWGGAGGCGIGKITRPKKRPRGKGFRLVIKNASRRPGTVLAVGTRIRLTLKFVRKPGRTRP